MNDGSVPVPDIRFSHTVIAVSDMDRALDFYRGVLGMDVVFDQRISGGGFDTALGSSGNEGRAVGGVLGGVGIELLSVAGDARGEASKPKRSRGGLQLISFSVPDVDETYTAVKAAVGDRAQAPFDVDEVRMFFVTDPDGTVIEFVEFPNGARNPAEFHRNGQGSE